MTAATSFLARTERFERVASTNDVVRRWLADGEPEVCLAVAAEQTAGRGRNGRTWTAPPGTGLLLSLGFRPTWLAADRVWRLAAVVSLAMAEAAEEVARLGRGTVGLKWPNDLVHDGGHVIRKLGGVLGESTGLGGDDPQVVVGIGLNVEWRESAFPAELAAGMTSLRAIAGASVPDVAADSLLDAFVARLEASVDNLRGGRFDAAGWSERQVTTGRTVEIVDQDGAERTVTATAVDPDTGALVVTDGNGSERSRSVLVGEVRRIRIAGL